MWHSECSTDKVLCRDSLNEEIMKRCIDEEIIIIVRYLFQDNDQSDLVQEVRLLRDIVRRQERRIDTLERRIIDLEEQNQQDKNIYLGDKNDTSSSSEEGELV